MKRKITLLFLFVSLLVLVQLYLPHIVECVGKTKNVESTWTSLSEEENLTESPAYSVQLFSDKDAYDPDNRVLISAYITGEGSIKESRILGHIPENVILGKVNITLFKFAKSLKGEWEGWKPIWPPEEFPMENRFVGILSTGYFSRKPDKPMLWSEGEMTDPNTNKSYPPISITFITNRGAPSGDHKVEFIFKYKSIDGKWSISKETLVIHIRSFLEKYNLAIRISFPIIIGICTAVLSSILHAKGKWVRRFVVEKHPLALSIICILIIVICIAVLFLIA